MRVYIISMIIIGLFAGYFLTAVPEVYAGDSPQEVSLDNPLSSKKSTDPSFLIGLIIKSILRVVGGLTLVMMVWGGFQWLTSAGNPDKVRKGSHTMIWAIIGLILVLGSYLLVSTVLNFLAGAGG